MTSQSESEEYYGGETGVNQGQWFISSLSSGDDPTLSSAGTQGGLTEHVTARKRGRGRGQSSKQCLSMVLHTLCTVLIHSLSLSLSLSPSLSLSLSLSFKPDSQLGGRPRSSSVGAGNRAGVLEMTSQSESEECYYGVTGVNQGQWFIPSLHS